MKNEIILLEFQVNIDDVWNTNERQEGRRGGRESVERKEIREDTGRRGGSILAGKIPWTEEPGRLQITGSQRVGQD